MATELQAFEQARQGVLQAVAPMMGMMRDRVAVKREDIERDRKLIDDKRLRDEARADWIERFNIQSNAAKDAAKAGREHTTSEREAVERYRSGEADYVYWRNRQDQLADRGWAVEQDEKEMRLKAAQWGMPNATDPATSLEDVYRHLYERAPQELAMLKKKQSEAFRRINPDMHKTYDALRDQRIGIKNQISDLIKNNQGATGLELANAIIPELLHWGLSDADIQNIRDNGLGVIAEVIKGNEARQAEINLILEKVNTAILSRKAENLRVELGLLLGKDAELLRTMQRIEKENPRVGLEDPEAYTNEAANRQLGDDLRGGENNRFEGLPVSGAGGEGAGAGGEGSFAPPTPMQGGEPITAPEVRWGRGGAETSDPDSSDGQQQYTTLPGENNLQTIANKFGVSLESLIRANPAVPHDQVVNGQTLYIPAHSALLHPGGPQITPSAIRMPAAGQGVEVKGGLPSQARLDLARKVLGEGYGGRFGARYNSPTGSSSINPFDHPTLTPDLLVTEATNKLIGELDKAERNLERLGISWDAKTGKVTALPYRRRYTSGGSTFKLGPYVDDPKTTDQLQSDSFDGIEELKKIKTISEQLNVLRNQAERQANIKLPPLGSGPRQ